MSDVTDYITLAELKAITDIAAADTSWDNSAPTLITEASQALNDYLQRQITPKDDGPTAQTIELGVADRDIDFAPRDLRAATSVVLHPEASSPVTLVQGTDYVLGPVGDPDGVFQYLTLSGYLVAISDRLFRFGQMQIQVTGSWGFAAVPAELKRACALTVQAWLRKQYSGAYRSEDPREVLAATPVISELPLAAMRLANPWRRAGGAV